MRDHSLEHPVIPRTNHWRGLCPPRVRVYDLSVYSRLIALLLVLTACAHRPEPSVGVASWYGPGFKGHPTASGERYRPGKRTAASKTLPFGTVVEVTRVDTGKSVRVTITDRGPFVAGRIIDLSRKAARKLDLIDDGTAKVEVRVVGCKDRYGRCE